MRIYWAFRKVSKGKKGAAEGNKGASLGVSLCFRHSYCPWMNGIYGLSLPNLKSQFSDIEVYVVAPLY